MEASTSSSDLKESIVASDRTENTFLLISDLHFGDLPQVAVDEFLDHVDLTRPRAVICSGDITLHSRPAEFALAGAFFAKLDQLNVPIVCVLH
jgi:3',5'-cyclic AMP phosphodiesterase CpdA